MFFWQKTVMTHRIFVWSIGFTIVLLVFQIYYFLAHLLTKKTSPGAIPSGGRPFRSAGRLDGQHLGLAFHLLNALRDMGLHRHRGFHEARRGLTKALGLATPSKPALLGVFFFLMFFRFSPRVLMQIHVV